MNAHATTLPQFVRDLLASPPRRGNGLNNWFYRVARVLHPYRDSNEIIELLQAATAGEHIKHGEIERAVERSKATAWKPGQPFQSGPPTSVWPPINVEQSQAIIRDGGGLVDLWEVSPVRCEDNTAHTEALIDALFLGNSLLCCGENSEGGWSMRANAPPKKERQPRKETAAGQWRTNGECQASCRKESAVENCRRKGSQWDPLESTCRHASLSIL